MSRRGKKVNAIEIGKAGEGGGVGIGDQPFAGIAALEGGGCEGGAAEKIAGQGLFAGAVFAFNGGYLHMRRDHVGLHEELSPGRADAGDGQGLWRVGFDEG